MDKEKIVKKVEWQATISIKYTALPVYKLEQFTFNFPVKKTPSVKDVVEAAKEAGFDNFKVIGVIQS